MEDPLSLLGDDLLSAILEAAGPLAVCRVAGVSRSWRALSNQLRGSFRSLGAVAARWLPEGTMLGMLGFSLVELLSNMPNHAVQDDDDVHSDYYECVYMSDGDSVYSRSEYGYPYYSDSDRWMDLPVSRHRIKTVYRFDTHGCLPALIGLCGGWAGLADRLAGQVAATAKKNEDAQKLAKQREDNLTDLTLRLSSARLCTTIGCSNRHRMRKPAVHATGPVCGACDRAPTISAKTY